MIGRKKLGFYVFNGAWAIYFFLWSYAHFQVAHSLSGLRLAVEVLLIFQNLLLVLFFTIRRIAKATSWNLWDVFIAFVGTFATTLFWPTKHGTPHVTAFLLQFLGSLTTLYASLSLGRSWGVLPANRSIQTKGMYRFIRHPIYASYQIFTIGYLINEHSLYNLMVGLISLLSQIMRISSEEKLLAKDPTYEKYRQCVRWRMIPYIY